MGANFMIDTIGFRIDLCEGQDLTISRRLQVLESIDGETGQLLSSFCKGSLSGSWDSRISCSIHDREWRWVEIPDHQKGGRTVQLPCDKWLRVEFSLQKWLYGVNCFSYHMEKALEGLYHFHSWLCGVLGVRLPDLSTWQVLRLDIGRVCHLVDDETMMQYLDSVKNFEFPRRRLRSIKYHSTVAWVGAGQCLKLYGKQAEFKAHDQRRVGSFFNNKDVGGFIHARLDGILRIELSLRKRVLQSYGIYRVFDLESTNLQKLWGKNMEQIGLKKRVARVWTSAEVIVHLKDHCVSGSKITAESAFSVWVDIVTNGRAAARQHFGKDKFYRATALFKKLGISTVAVLEEKEIPPAPCQLQEFIDNDLISLLTSESSSDLPFRYMIA